MKYKYNKRALFALLLTALMSSAQAQTGGCTKEGNIEYNQYVDYTGAAGGDQTVGTTGSIEVADDGVYTIYGALINNGTVKIQNGGVLNLYGDFQNNAKLIVEVGGTLNFYGATWTNGTMATVEDGVATANTTPGGAVNFIAPRPVVEASWLATSACLSAFSGGDALQSIDGGDVSMDIALHVQNANNIVLINSNTKIEGTVSMDIDNGDVILNTNDFVFTENATITGYSANRMVVTSNSNDGHMVKEATSTTFFFPVGIAEGDYTPAEIVGAGPYHVSVTDYTASSSMESNPLTGIDRTWHIFGSTATSMTLYHNNSTDGSAYTDSLGYITQYLGTGSWYIGSPEYVSPGVHTTTVVSPLIPTTGTVDGSYFTKSLGFTPLPIEFLDLSAWWSGDDGQLKWTVANERNNSHFDVLRSIDGANFESIGVVESLGDYAQERDYAFSDIDAINLHSDRIYYKIVQYDLDGSKSSSDIALLTKNNAFEAENMKLYPNPNNGVFTISGNVHADVLVLRIYNSLGQLVYSEDLNVSNNKLDASVILDDISSGVYILTLSDKDSVDEIIYKEQLLNQ